jgi:hypothetical protein
MQHVTRPPTTVRCEPGAHDVPAREAQEICPADTAMTGPGREPRYACHDHIRSGGLVPVTTHVGRRDGTPMPARRPA